MKKFLNTIQNYTSLIVIVLFCNNIHATTCANAINIPTVPVTNQPLVCELGNDLNSTTVAATCGGASNSYKGGNEALYTFTPSSSGNYDISISGLTWTAIFVYAGCPTSGGTCVNSIGTSATSKSITVSMTVGTQYFIWFDTWPTPDSPCPGTFSIAAAAPPPSNDECAGAIPLTVGTSCTFTQYTNTAASGSVGPPAPGCASYSGGDVWFSVVVPAGGRLIIDSNTGVVTDGGMAIYSGSCGALTLIECDDDDSANGLMSFIDRSGLTPGSTIYIRFWEFGNDNPGTFSICVSTPAPPPANDLCSNAIALSCGQTLTGYTVSSTSDSAPSCNGFTNTSPGVWYAFTGNGGTATISLCGSAFDTRLSVYTGTCGTFTCVTADDDTCDPGLQSIVSFATTPCVTYYVLVHGFSSAVGNFTIAATCTAPPAPPANDVCSGAETVTCGSTIAGNTSTATPDGGYCRSCNDIGGGRGVWYKLTGNGAQVTLNLCGSSFNTTVDVYSGSCASLIPVVSNDNDGVVCMSNRSRAVFNASVGTDYYILVSGVAECDLGAFTMNISCLCGPTLSAPWTVNNIGSSNGNGIDNVCNGTIDISASNFGSPSSDVQTFANQEFCGNFTITAKLESVTNLGWGGLMVRENDAPGSKKVALRTQLNSLFVRDLRATTNGVQSQQQWSRPTHSWMRITRTGNTFIGYTSFNGVNWQQTFIATLVLPTCIDAGLFAQSINVNTPTLAAFSNLGGFNTQIPNITDQNTENRSIETEKEFSVYPNPASDAVNVKWISGYNGKAANINIINQLGQVVVTQKISAVTNDTENIDISHLTDGMYIISVQSEDKQTVYRKFTVGSIRP